MKCPNCDVENRAGARFCKDCGMGLTRGAVSQTLYGGSGSFDTALGVIVILMCANVFIWLFGGYLFLDLWRFEPLALTMMFYDLGLLFALAFLCKREPLRYIAMASVVVVLVYRISVRYGWLELPY